MKSILHNLVFYGLKLITALFKRKEPTLVSIKIFSRPGNSLLKPGILLLSLAILDSFFTDFGIRNNHIQEANPLVSIIYDTSILGFYAIKIGLPILLIYILTKIDSKPYLHILVQLTLLFYLLVVALHIVWISFTL